MNFQTIDPEGSLLIEDLAIFFISLFALPIKSMEVYNNISATITMTIVWQYSEAN